MSGGGEEHRWRGSSTSPARRACPRHRVPGAQRQGRQPGAGRTGVRTAVENPFFTSVAPVAEDVLGHAGYSAVLCNTDDDPTKEARYLSVAEHENMAGVLIAPARGKPELGPLLERGRAVVALDRRVGQPVDHVMFDNVALGDRTTGAARARQLPGQRRLRGAGPPARAGGSAAGDRGHQQSGGRRGVARTGRAAGGGGRPAGGGRHRRPAIRDLQHHRGASARAAARAAPLESVSVIRVRFCTYGTGLR
ncbi:hypothetical protein [Ruania suaedae]|uniref:hypothetical protein n=1 Tax=Ruania suaedae TaxID=2897774 RepID=UPI00338F24B6